MNIATAVCVDLGSESKSTYPMLKGAEDKRSTYWRCALTFFLTSKKFNPSANHTAYTNDNNLENLTVDGHRVNETLTNLGVRLERIPFDIFNPREYSKRFRNAFFKHEAIHALSRLTEPSILLDSDCVWTNSCVDIFEKITNDKCLLLQDTYQRSSSPKSKSPHNLSMEDMGKLYKRMRPMKIQTKYPIWYGGELIGGSAKHLEIVSGHLQKTLEYCKTQEDTKKNSMTFENGMSIFDNDEFISSYVYNSLAEIPIHDTFGVFSKRMWTLPAIYNFEKKDLNIPIWHLPAEKERGFKKLYNELVDPNSLFWTSNGPASEFLGGFFNIPKAKPKAIPALTATLRKCKIALRKTFKHSSD